MFLDLSESSIEDETKTFEASNDIDQDDDENDGGKCDNQDCSAELSLEQGRIKDEAKGNVSDDQKLKSSGSVKKKERKRQTKKQLEHIK